MAAVEETKLVDLALGPREQSAIDVMKNSLEVQDEPTLGGVSFVGKEEGMAN